MNEKDEITEVLLRFKRKQKQGMGEKVKELYLLFERISSFALDYLARAATNDSGTSAFQCLKY